MTAVTCSSCIFLHIDAGLVLCGLVVNIGLSVVLLLVELVTDSIGGSLSSGAEGCITVLGDVLVGLLRCGRTGALDGLANVVGGVPEVMLESASYWRCGKPYLMVSIVIFGVFEMT